MQSDSPAPSAERQASELDPVYRPWVQLLAVIFLLLLFCLTWTSAAFVIVPPFEFSHDTVVYQCSYAVLAVSLGLFFIMYYCICRSDIRSCCLESKQSFSSESSRWRYMKATSGVTSRESGKLRENGSAVSGSHGIDESSTVRAAESLSVAAKSIHSDTDHGTSTKINTSQFTAPAVAIPECVTFYNPRQNGVARKYWERSRKKRAMANLYHTEAQLHRFGEDTKPDGTSGNTTPNGNIKSAVNGVHQKVVMAAVENVPEHVIQLPDEQQPLLSAATQVSATDSHGRTVSLTSSDIGTSNLIANKCEHIPDTAVMQVSSVAKSCHSNIQNAGNLQNCAEDSKSFVATASELCSAEQSAIQHSSSIDATEPAPSNSKNIELHSVGDTNCLLPTSCQNSLEKDTTAEEHGTHSPNSGTAHAFINKNYCASTLRTSVASRKSDCRDSEVKETSPDVSHDSTPDIWVRQHSKLLKLKTETSV